MRESPRTSWGHTSSLQHAHTICIPKPNVVFSQVLITERTISLACLSECNYIVIQLISLVQLKGSVLCKSLLDLCFISIHLIVKHHLQEKARIIYREGCGVSTPRAQAVHLFQKCAIGVENILKRSLLLIVDK